MAAKTMHMCVCVFNARMNYVCFVALLK